MKKALAFVAAATMVFSMFTACSSKQEDNKTADNNAAANNTQTTDAKKDNTSSEGETIKLGSMGPLTGDVSVYGISVTNGIKLAVDEINAAGGINGKQVELITLDEKGDTAEAVNAYNKLMSEKVVAIVGSVTSAPTSAVADLAAQEYADGQGTLVITPSGTALDITTYGENIFRTCYTDPFQGKVMANYVAENMNATKVAIIYDNSSDYSQGIANAFAEQAAAKGLEVVAKESYGSADVDFNTQLTTIQSKEPDVLFIPDYYGKVSLIASQARSAGITVPMLGGDGWDGVMTVLDDNNKSVLDGCYFANHFSTTDTDEKVQKFVKAYEAAYSETPTAFSALAYDSVYMIKQVIEATGSTEAQEVVKGMQEINYSGITGNITFDENGDPIKSISILKIQDGNVTLDSKLDAE